MPFFETDSPNDAKLRELILFIASRSVDDERFGSIKLNKLLFFADFLAYVRLGKSITGHLYQRLPKGPAPKKMLPIMEKMEADKVLAIRTRDYHGREQKVPLALRDAKLDLFSGDEIAVVTEVLDDLRKKNAKGISTLSHQFSGWERANNKEIIPYEVALVHFAKPRKKDLAVLLKMEDEIADLRKELPDSDAE